MPIAKIIDGKAIAAQIQQELKDEIYKERFVPRLDVVLVGNDPASQVYVQKKYEACHKVGISSVIHHLDGTQDELYDKIEELNHCGLTHGILVQLPLPGFDTNEVFNAIHPFKDVDVFHPTNVGLLVQGRPRFQPCTPHGIQVMLNRSGISVKGKHVVVINRSNIVGKPLSSMLIQDNDEFANATVTVCHNSTPPEQLASITRMADIVVVAVGIPNFLKADMLRPGAVVVDVGTTKVAGKLLGDADPTVWEVASYVTPVPGGVGPMTVAMLLVNTLQAARYHCAS